MRSLPLLCAAAMLVAASSLAHAQWKWKDARGQVHVSDVPPPRDIQDKDILQRPAPAQRRPPASAPPVVPTSAATGARPTTDPELDARKAKAEADAKARAKADEDRIARQRAENCQRARQQIAMLNSGTRIARIDAKGEHVYLEDQDRANEIAQAQRVVDSDCR